MLRPEQIMFETPVVHTVTNNIQNNITQQARAGLWKCLHIQALNKSRPDLRGTGAAFFFFFFTAPPLCSFQPCRAVNNVPYLN